MFTKRIITKSIILYVTICLLIMPIIEIKTVEAASLVEKLLYSAAAVTLITTYYNNVNDKGQANSLATTQKQTGVYDNDEAKQRIHDIKTQLIRPGLIKKNYEIYANPKTEFNAFCTLGNVISINKGALDTLDDDELAFVMSHEMGHGEKKHVVTGITKGVSLGLAVDLFVSSNKNNTSAILSTIGANYINNEMFTMEQEWEADNLGFAYLVAAGYNPGGSAASMVKLRSMYGELYHEGLGKIVNPNNHPKTSDRVNSFSDKLTAYSNNHVRVKNDKTIMVDNKELLTPSKTTHYLGEERAYLIAGNLAKVYHNNTNTAVATVGDDGAVYIGNQKISNLTENDISPDEFINRINELNLK